jgi:hypothetical protein
MVDEAQHAGVIPTKRGVIPGSPRELREGALEEVGRQWRRKRAGGCANDRKDQEEQ